MTVNVNRSEWIMTVNVTRSEWINRTDKFVLAFNVKGFIATELRSCVKVEVAVLGFPS